MPMSVRAPVLVAAAFVFLEMAWGAKDLCVEPRAVSGIADVVNLEIVAALAAILAAIASLELGDAFYVGREVAPHLTDVAVDRRPAIPRDQTE